MHWTRLKQGDTNTMKKQLALMLILLLLGLEMPLILQVSGQDLFTISAQPTSNDPDDNDGDGSTSDNCLGTPGSTENRGCPIDPPIQGETPTHTHTPTPTVTNTPLPPRPTILPDYPGCRTSPNSGENKNIRSQATTDSQKIAALTYLETIEVIGKETQGSETWYRVELPDGTIGYMFSSTVNPPIGQGCDFETGLTDEQIAEILKQCSPEEAALITIDDIKALPVNVQLSYVTYTGGVCSDLIELIDSMAIDDTLAVSDEVVQDQINKCGSAAPFTLRTISLIEEEYPGSAAKITTAGDGCLNREAISILDAKAKGDIAILQCFDQKLSKRRLTQLRNTLALLGYAPADHETSCPFINYVNLMGAIEGTEYHTLYDRIKDCTVKTYDEEGSMYEVFQIFTQGVIVHDLIDEVFGGGASTGQQSENHPSLFDSFCDNPAVFALAYTRPIEELRGDVPRIFWECGRAIMQLYINHLKDGPAWIINRISSAGRPCEALLQYAESGKIYQPERTPIPTVTDGTPPTFTPTPTPTISVAELTAPETEDSNVCRVLSLAEVELPENCHIQRIPLAAFIKGQVNTLPRDIYTLNSDGTQEMVEHRLPEKDVLYPALSPDGLSMAYVIKTADKAELTFYWIDSAFESPKPEIQIDEAKIIWENISHIIFSAKDEAGIINIYRFNVDTTRTKPELIVENGRNPTLSPNGSVVIFESGEQLMWTNLSNPANAVSITVQINGEALNGCGNPVFSPNPKFIYLTCPTEAGSSVVKVDIDAETDAIVLWSDDIIYNLNANLAASVLTYDDGQNIYLTIIQDDNDVNIQQYSPIASPVTDFFPR